MSNNINKNIVEAIAIAELKKRKEWEKNFKHRTRTRVCSYCHLLEKAYLEGNYTVLIPCIYPEHRFVPLVECGIEGHDHSYSVMEKYYY